MAHYGDLWSEITAAVLPAMCAYRASVAAMPVRHKPDGTAVCEADKAIQDLIISILSRHDSRAGIVAEEGSPALDEAVASGRIWVVDPIDGTSQFLDPRRVEFCSVVAVLEAGVPVACMVLAPELGRGRVPVLLTADGEGRPPMLSGEPAEPAQRTQLVSTTRRSASAVSRFEALATRTGLVAKTRPTSQTLDMARTAVDLERATGLASFRWFAATRQLLWDAVAGMALARAAGRVVADAVGTSIAPIAPCIIASSDPRINSTIIATQSDIDWIVADGARAVGSHGGTDA